MDVKGQLRIQPQSFVIEGLRRIKGGRIDPSNITQLRVVEPSSFDQYSMPLLAGPKSACDSNPALLSTPTSYFLLHASL